MQHDANHLTAGLGQLGGIHGLSHLALSVVREEVERPQKPEVLRIWGGSRPYAPRNHHGYVGRALRGSMSLTNRWCYPRN